MFNSHLNTRPITNFIVIKDSIQENGTEFLAYFINLHLNSSRNLPVIFCEFEFNRKLKSMVHYEKMEVHSFLETFKSVEVTENLRRLAILLQQNAFIFIDSIGHMIHKFGLEATYKVLHRFRKNQSTIQLVGLLHTDLFDKENISITHIEQLATFNIQLLPKFGRQLPRISYLFKKSAAKSISGLEHYEFINGVLQTRELEKLDIQKLIHQPAEVSPETLTTFKIGLTESDKELRDQLILPYLPKEHILEEVQPGDIIYELDDGDDWDDEDPDDDLDI